MRKQDDISARWSIGSITTLAETGFMGKQFLQSVIASGRISGHRPRHADIRRTNSKHKEALSSFHNIFFRSDPEAHGCEISHLMRLLRYLYHNSSTKF